jgi:hypothetical protein
MAMKMNDIIGWRDWLDTERADRTGEFFLHRNYYNGHIDKLLYYHSANPERSLKEDSYNTTNNPVYIDETPPVAKGVLAFLVEGNSNKASLRNLLKWNKDFSATDYYREYFDYQVGFVYRDNDRLPIPQNKVDVIKRFIPQHLTLEKLKYKQSSKYFEEFLNEKDKEVKMKLKGYVEGYFYWVALLAMDKGAPTKEIFETPNTILEEVCVSHEAYINIVKWFIEHGFVDGQTLIWKDTGRGNASILVNYIRDLRPKGYVKRKLLSPLIHSIVQHDFGFEMGIDIVKKATKGNDPYNLPVIPYFKAQKNIPPQG